MKWNTKQLKFEILNLLKQLPVLKRVSDKQVVVRCPYCGDSEKHPNKGHMYVEIEYPYRCHCFRNECSTSLDNLLIDLNLYDKNIIEQIKLEANLKKDTTILEEVKSLLNTLLEAWKEAMKQAGDVIKQQVNQSERKGFDIST